MKNPSIYAIIPITGNYLRKGAHKMYQIGELVMYGIHGVCRVIDVETRTIDRRKMDYLVLEPQGQKESRYYVPAGNPNAMAKLRPMLSREALDELLLSAEVREDSWITDENARKQYYRELISCGDRVKLLRMIRSLYRHKQEQEAMGRKFHLCDENFLRDAQRLIDTEFSTVLGIPPVEVRSYVTEKLNV